MSRVRLQPMKVQDIGEHTGKVSYFEALQSLVTAATKLVRVANRITVSEIPEPMRPPLHTLADALGRLRNLKLMKEG